MNIRKREGTKRVRRRRRLYILVLNGELIR
jgi:hypothetical protein